jgi:very-short-patch-repair endonuclease
VSISCPSHGLFLQTASNHMHGSGCPRCRQSKGERDVRAFLLLLGFEFEEQKKFPNCVDKRELPFDFYVPSANLLIEFDGEQHFFERNTGIFKGKFNDIVRRDLIKNKFAASSNFNLLRISWKEDVSYALSTYFEVMS